MKSKIVLIVFDSMCIDSWSNFKAFLFDFFLSYMAYIGRIVEIDHPDAKTERLIILFIRDDGRFVAFPESTKSSEVIGELAH